MTEIKIAKRQNASKKMTAEARARAATLYASGMSTAKIGALLGVAAPTIRYHLIQGGISRRFVRHTWDDEFFDRIDTESKAYWLGFIAADGHVASQARGAPVLTICLAPKDREHLVAFRLAMRGTHRILQNGKFPRVSITSQRVADGLKAHGVTPKKTHRLRFPRLSVRLRHHFMRGYFDGDGCIYKGRGPSVSFSLTGNRKFILGYQIRLMRACGLTKTTLGHRRNKRTPTMYYGGRTQLRRIRDFLYRDATVFLGRKRDKFALI